MAEKRSLHRSPSYPAIGLREAVEKAAVLFKKDGQAGSSRESAFEHLGYTGATGTSLTVLSALKKYGLTRFDKGRIFLTDDALLILLPGGDRAQRAEAIKRCALRPELYAKLWQEYGQTGLPSDATLKSKFVKELGFNARKIGGAIGALRETLSYSGIVSGQPHEEEHEDEVESMNGQMSTDSQRQLRVDGKSQPQSDTQDYRIPRSDNKLAVLRIELPISKHDVENITKWWDLMKSILISSDQPNRIGDEIKK